jgi:hypothetical protein
MDAMSVLGNHFVGLESEHLCSLLGNTYCPRKCCSPQTIYLYGFTGKSKAMLKASERGHHTMCITVGHDALEELEQSLGRSVGGSRAPWSLLPGNNDLENGVVAPLVVSKNLTTRHAYDVNG